MGKQSQLLLQPTEVELGLQVGVQVGVEFDNQIGNSNQSDFNEIKFAINHPNICLIEVSCIGGILVKSV